MFLFSACLETKLQEMKVRRHRVFHFGKGKEIKKRLKFVSQFHPKKLLRIIKTERALGFTSKTTDEREKDYEPLGQALVCV
jgi:hypothetical protein